eukprot:Selendium_serpulae@DN5374_c0_g1_i1.p1
MLSIKRLRVAADVAAGQSPGRGAQLIGLAALLTLCVLIYPLCEWFRITRRGMGPVRMAPLSPQRFSFSTKLFAYLIQGERHHTSPGLRVSDTRDIFWLTYKERFREESDFYTHRDVTYTPGCNILLEMALAVPVLYEYFVLMDDDMLQQVRHGDWLEMENWVLRDRPGNGYFSKTTKWQRQSKNETICCQLAVDGKVTYTQQRMVGKLLPYDEGLEHESAEYSSFVQGWIVAGRYPNSRLGNNKITVNLKKDKHTRNPISKSGKEPRDFPRLDSYILETYFNGTLPPHLAAENWEAAYAAENLNRTEKLQIAHKSFFKRSWKPDPE